MACSIAKRRMADSWIACNMQRQSTHRCEIHDIMSVSEREQAMLAHRERRMAIMIAAYAASSTKGANHDIIKERACLEHEEGKLQILTNLIKRQYSDYSRSCLTRKMNMTEECVRSKMR